MRACVSGVVLTVLAKAVTTEGCLLRGKEKGLDSVPGGGSLVAWPSGVEAGLEIRAKHVRGSKWDAHSPVLLEEGGTFFSDTAGQRAVSASWHSPLLPSAPTMLWQMHPLGEGRGSGRSAHASPPRHLADAPGRPL